MKPAALGLKVSACSTQFASAERIAVTGAPWVLALLPSARCATRRSRAPRALDPGDAQGLVVESGGAVEGQFWMRRSCSSVTGSAVKEETVRGSWKRADELFFVQAGHGEAPLGCSLQSITLRVKYYMSCRDTVKHIFPPPNPQQFRGHTINPAIIDT